MEGRIPTKVATKYLVECSFASTRELVVVALLPDLTGPTASFRDKPTGERCRAKRDHLINFYVKKDRIGVITPADKFKKVVKDIYIIPLRKDDALPEPCRALECLLFDRWNRHFLPSPPYPIRTNLHRRRIRSIIPTPLLRHFLPPLPRRRIGRLLQ